MVSQQGRKLLSDSQSQELSQGTDLAPDWLFTLMQPICSHISLLTQLSTLTTTQQFPLRGGGGVKLSTQLFLSLSSSGSETSFGEGRKVSYPILTGRHAIIIAGDKAFPDRRSFCFQKQIANKVILSLFLISYTTLKIENIQRKKKSISTPNNEDYFHIAKL